MENNYTVYMHISPSNKRYIGITSQKPENRWSNGNGYKYSPHFYRAIEKYGWDNFEHIIIAKGLTEDEAKWLETELIKEWDSTNQDKGYNITLGGEGANGLVHTEETKKKISKSRKDKGCALGENNPMFGKQRTVEWRQEHSTRMIGESNPMAQMIILLNTKEIFTTIKEGAEKYNCDPSYISKCCNGKAKSCGRLEDGLPLVWMYYNEYLNLTEEEVNKKIKDVDSRIILLNTNEIFQTAREGAKKYNIKSSSNITACCRGKLKSTGKHPITNEGLVWIFYKDYQKL